MRDSISPRLLALAAGLAATPVALAQQTFYTYSGPDFGNWNAAGNWTPFGVPAAAGDVAIIPGGLTCRLGLTGPLARTVDKIAVQFGGQLELLNDFDLTILAQTDNLGVTGLMGVPGILFMSGTVNSTDLILSGPANSFVVFGGGTPTTPALIQMSNSVNNRIYGATGQETLVIQQAAVIRGGGQVGVNQLGIDNAGTIRATQPAGIIIDPNGLGMTNTGLIDAEGGPVQITFGTLTNTGGLIRAGTDDVLLANCTIIGGTFTSTSGAVRSIAIGASTVLNGVTNTGLLRQTNDADMTLANTLVNNGVYEVNAAGNLTDVYLSTNVSISGTGHLVMNNSGANRIIDVTGSNVGRTLTNTGGHTIRGSGQLGANTLSIVNEATASIIAEGTANLVIDPASTLLNQGVLRAATGGVLRMVPGTYTFQTPVSAASGGVVVFQGGTYSGQVSIEAGGVAQVNTTGAGTVLSNLSLAGRLEQPNDVDAVYSGTFSNSGVVALMASGNLSDFYLADSLVINGGGEIVASNTLNNRLFDVTGANQGRTLNLTDQTIRGGIQLGANSLSVVIGANGRVIGQGTAGIQIDPASTLVNNGTLRSDAGSNLNFVAGTYTFNTPAVAAGTNFFSAGTFTGQIATEGAGQNRINVTGAGVVFNNITSTGALLQPNDTDLVLQGTYDQRGTHSVAGAANATDLYLNSDLEMIGAGEIVFSNTLGNRVFDVTGGNQGRTLTVTNQTLRGSAQLAANTISLVIGANGRIIGQGSSGFQIDPANSLINNGTLRSDPGSNLNFVAGTYTFNTPAVAAGTNFFSAGTFTGRIDSEGAGVSRINVTGAGVVFNNIINLGAVLQPNDTDLVLQGTYDQRGTHSVAGGPNLTDLYLASSVNLVGGGEIVFSNTLNNRVFDVTGGNQGRTLTISSQTIRGAGQIGVNTINFINAGNGAIIGQGSSGMQIDPASTFVNDGLLRSDDGSNLNFVAGTYTFNTPAVAAGTNFFSSGTFTGRIDSEGAGVSRINVTGTGVVFSNIINLGAVLQPNDTDLVLQGTYDQRGTHSVAGGSNLTDLYLATNVNLVGGGEIVFSNTLNNRVFDVTGGNQGRTLTISSQTIRGAGQIGVNTINVAIAPGGTVISDASNGLTIDASSTFSNDGLLRAANGNIVIQPATFSTTGNVVIDASRNITLVSGPWPQTGGVTLVNGVLQINSGQFNLIGGRLAGTGTVNAAVNNSTGIMAPGSPTGVLNLSGDYTQQSGGVFEFQVGSTTDPALNDTLIAPTANLSGIIRINRVGNFVPPIGQGFTIVGTAPNQRFGTFALIESNDFWTITYLHNAAVAVFQGLGTPVCLVDFNADGFLNQEDLGGYLTAFLNEPTDAGPSGTSTFPCPGQPAPYDALGYAADFNRDCNFDQEDLGGFITEFFSQIENPNGCIPG